MRFATPAEHHTTAEQLLPDGWAVRCDCGASAVARLLGDAFAGLVHADLIPQRASA